MRSPLIAFSLVAAAVSPTLASVHSNSPNFGRSIAHSRVTEVDNASAGPMRFKRSGLTGLGLNKFASGGNPLDEVLPQDASAASTPSLNSDAATHSGDPDPFSSENLHTVNNAAAAVPSVAAATTPSNALGSVPASAVEPVAPANPYSGSQVAAATDNNAVVPAGGGYVPNRAELEKTFGPGGAAW
ncbi:hypothetical protein C8Q72DRAFT_795187 [Fomitopsis betulina]|nr:hypothetical protein C8Q72DRAFT_795187 [Fomitopsis betulina]